MVPLTPTLLPVKEDGDGQEQLGHYMERLLCYQGGKTTAGSSSSNTVGAVLHYRAGAS